ncbi:hypothetical protein [Brevundimonas sp. SL130]|uniref:hypothetical protein n=1 Tax=Brevundimonas sp. SL130 TaxID=2995143 RepID=UPI00226C8303|nr:hypothetical protein [Brevundimonas sp. SL130]WAC59650.1 hypothetical protein OU998_15755 [Brevundimonas sp. SL130]
MDAFLQSLAEGEQRLVKCQPMPSRWMAFAAKHPFTWTHVPFSAATGEQVPQEPGFYCFFVGLPPASLPPIGFPLYVGKTERTLRTRFREYVREKDDDEGRVRARKFLKVFEGELYFSFTVFRGTPAEVKAIETELHNALMPAYSDIGYDADVREARQAWQ